MLIKERTTDAFERWRRLQLTSTDRSNRIDDRVDLAFWQQIADRYDEGSLARQVPEIVDQIVGLVGTGKSVLEVGCGTGGFTIPVAEAGNRVTALDYAPSMLAVLGRKLATRPDLPITITAQKIETADVPPHDIVLAVNALYRVVEIESVVRTLDALARERVVIVWSVGRQPPWRRMVNERLAPGRYEPGADYIHLLDALYQADILANCELVPVERTYRYPTEAAAIGALVDWSAPTEAELTLARTLLGEVFLRDGDGFVSHQRSFIAVITWGSGVRGRGPGIEPSVSDHRISPPLQPSAFSLQPSGHLNG